MHIREILEKYAEKEGWSDEEKIVALVDFIVELDDPDALDAFLEERTSG